MTEYELMRELEKEFSIPPIDADEVTARQLADRIGVNRQTADAILKSKVAAGELTVRAVKMPDGKVAKAYRKVIKD